MAGLLFGGQHVGDGRLDDADLDALRDLDLGLIVADLGDAAANPAAGDDLVALLDRGDRGLMLLHPPLLRADHQDVEDHEDQQPRQRCPIKQAAWRRRLAGRRGLDHHHQDRFGLDIWSC